MLTRLAVLAGLSMTVGLPAIAAPVDLSNPARITNTFQNEEIAAIANELGYDTTLLTGDDGKKVLVVEMPTGGIFVFPQVCETKAPRCLQVEWLAIFDVKDTPISVINAYNDRQGFARAFQHEGKVFLSRQEIADFGIPIGNIAVSLGVFAKLTDNFAAFLASSGKSAILNSPDAPNAAAHSFGGQPVVASTAIRAEDKLPKGAENFIFKQ